MHEQVEQPVPAALRLHVRRICGYRITGCRPGTHVGMPSADITCVFDLGNGLDLSGLDLPGIRRFPTSFSGLCTGPATIHHDGTQHGIMLYLTATGLHDLFGLPAREIAGSVIDLNALLGRDGAELAERVRSAPGWSGLAVLTQILLDRMPGRPADDLAAQTWQRLQAAGGARSVESLAAESGWSVRHLSGRFTAEFGIGPKAAARLLRFERSVRAVQRCTTLADAAYACGYADQAHLTREWQQLAGMSPSRWLALDEFTSAEPEAALQPVRA